MKLQQEQDLRILVGDIGATHSRLATCSLRAGRFELLRQQVYASNDHDGLTEVLAQFLENEREQIEAACLGVPGPVHSGVVRLTNLPWKVDRREVLRTVGTDRVTLVNDVEAAAAGIPGLDADSLACLQPGQADPTGNRVVISIGTGLGVSALPPNGPAFATEAGHASFAPQRPFDFKLQAVLAGQYGHVSWERVASGPALPRIHALLADSPTVQLKSSDIVRTAAVDPLCRLALEKFRRYLGAAAGNIALSLMASGGIYLCGGVAPKVLGSESASMFIKAFRDKGRMDSLLDRIPIFVVNQGDLALRGAARTAAAQLESAEP